MTAWIMVSDSSRARLFTTELPEDKWSLVQEFDHPEGRETSREIRPSSPPGRSVENQGKGGRHTSMQPRTTPKEAEAERFSQHLSHYLESALAKHQFDALVLVAPPHFLGLLREALGQQTARLVKSTVDKDYNALDASELRQRLLGVVFPGVATPGKP